MRVGRPKKPTAHVLWGLFPKRGRSADSAIRASAAAFQCFRAPRHAKLQRILCVVAGDPMADLPDAIAPMLLLSSGELGSDLAVGWNGYPLGTFLL